MGPKPKVKTCKKVVLSVQKKKKMSAFYMKKKLFVGSKKKNMEKYFNRTGKISRWIFLPPEDTQCSLKYRLGKVIVRVLMCTLNISLNQKNIRQIHILFLSCIEDNGSPHPTE